MAPASPRPGLTSRGGSTTPAERSTSPDAPVLRLGARVVALLFTISGVLHLVRPSIYTSIVPDVLPAHTFLVVVSGAAELLCAAGLVARPTRRWAGAASAALLLAVFPANVTMAFEAWRSWSAGHDSGFYLAGTLLRLPLQLPLIWWAWRATEQGQRPGDQHRRPGHHVDQQG